MEAAYFTAAIPEPFRILGLALKPLSLGRYRLLKRFECAFVSEQSESATIPDLLLGCVICSMRVDEFMAILDRGQLGKEVEKWAKRICPLAWLGTLPLIGRKWRDKYSFNAFEKMGLFKSYIEAGSEVPKYWDNGKSDGKPSGAHWAQSVEVTLRSKCGWTTEDINEQPLSKALSDYFKYAENEGLIQLMTPEEIAVVEAAT